MSHRRTVCETNNVDETESARQFVPYFPSGCQERAEGRAERDAVQVFGKRERLDWVCADPGVPEPHGRSDKELVTTTKDK